MIPSCTKPSKMSSSSSHVALTFNLTSSKTIHHHHHHKHISFHNYSSKLFSSHYMHITSNIDRPTWTFHRDTTKSGNNSEQLMSIKEEEEEVGKRKVYSEVIGEREVVCEVEVVSWKERRIKAEILVDADIQSVWNALTDYESLADFIPNLVSCERIPCPHPGRIWLEQRGLQRALYWKIEARVVLDLQEFFNSENDREIHFSMVDGDFKKFEGKWCLKSGNRSSKTTLSYEVTVVPKFNIPAILLEKVIRSELPVNLQAVACRAESNFEGNQNC